MTKDPLFQQIVAALNRDLDEDLFEKCAAALLRESYPSLAPMAGGNDAGYDGSRMRGLEWAKASAERELRDERREAVRGL